MSDSLPLDPFHYLGPTHYRTLYRKIDRGLHIKTLTKLCKNNPGRRLAGLYSLPDAQHKTNQFILD